MPDEGGASAIQASLIVTEFSAQTTTADNNNTIKTNGRTTLILAIDKTGYIRYADCEGVRVMRCRKDPDQSGLRVDQKNGTGVIDHIAAVFLNHIKAIGNTNLGGQAVNLFDGTPEGTKVSLVVADIF